jgi:signal transduction histidine kinase/CheY-like chemotaxis protein
LAAAGRDGTPATGDDLSRMPVISRVLAADSLGSYSGFGVLHQGDRYLQVGCVAIELEGYSIGLLLIGERLDLLVPRLGAAAATEAVVTAGREVVASTLDGVTPGMNWKVAQPDSVAHRLRYAGQEYVTATLPLGLTDDGRVATLHLMRSLTGSITPVLTSLRSSFLVAGIVAVLLVGGGAMVVSRTTLRPLSAFVQFMRSGADAGTLAQFADPAAPQEIRTLTDAYNRLIESLSRQHLQLEERSMQLASVNESLEEEVHERERAERALRDSEEQLRQSQKLESLGTLAGGVAHDFNNLLSVILGYAQIVTQDIPPGSPLEADVAQISQAADRASGLVRQLLAFSRKQVLQPQVIDLNQTVGGMSTMLRRLIGEDIDLQTRLEPRLARVKADPGQIEQVLMNLVVNARDAMPNGGTVMIETANTELQTRYERRHETIESGPVVMLTVSDSGNGMDAATRARIFEPFFTTKPAGMGTGLGLSTVYGIVRQSGGSITVHSEPGQGCTFRCCFPAMTEVAEAEPARPDGVAASGHETVLVAEDEPQLRSLVRRCLVARGYSVLDACDGAEALRIAAAHNGPLELLVTDLVMPNVSGKELAERLLIERPSLRVLYMSGYSDEAIARHGELTPGAVFLQKPVTPDALVRAVRAALDSEPTLMSVV